MTLFSKESFFVILKFFVSVSLLTPLAGCSQLSTKTDNKVDYVKYSQQSEPLSSELGQKEEYEFALDLARLDVERERYDHAEVLLQKLRKAKGDDIRLYRLLAQIYEAQQKNELCLVAWQEVNKRAEATIDDESELARLFLMQSEYASAETIYQAWLNHSDTGMQVTALNNLGFSALLQKKYTDAENFFLQALQKDPLNSKAINNLKLVKTLVE
jgi:Tfp pilus assembly protein PilF